MGRFVGAVAVLAVVSGCGTEGAPAEPGGVAVLIGTPSVKERRLLPTTVVTTAVPPAKAREGVRAGLQVRVPGASEGQLLSVVIGMAGCGFSVDAVGKAKVVNGVAQIRLNRPLPADAQREVVLSLDADGDGRCTEADTMWSGLVVTGQDDLLVTLDLEELEPGPSWMCFSGAGDEG